jgi:hypothetical protein
MVCHSLCLFPHAEAVSWGTTLSAGYQNTAFLPTVTKRGFLRSLQICYFTVVLRFSLPCELGRVCPQNHSASARGQFADSWQLSRSSFEMLTRWQQQAQNIKMAVFCDRLIGSKHLWNIGKLLRTIRCNVTEDGHIRTSLCDNLKYLLKNTAVFSILILQNNILCNEWIWNINNPVRF